MKNLKEHIVNISVALLVSSIFCLIVCIIISMGTIVGSPFSDDLAALETTRGILIMVDSPNVNRIAKLKIYNLNRNSICYDLNFSKGYQTTIWIEYLKDENKLTLSSGTYGLKESSCLVKTNDSLAIEYTLCEDVSIWKTSPTCNFNQIYIGIVNNTLVICGGDVKCSIYSSTNNP